MNTTENHPTDARAEALMPQNMQPEARDAWCVLLGMAAHDAKYSGKPELLEAMERAAELARAR